MSRNLRGYEGYKRTPTDGRNKVKCPTCETEIAARNLTPHKQSVLHKQNRRLRSLLNKDCLTFTEIAERCGVTREWVRRISERLGTEKGVTRMRACSANRTRRAAATVQATHPILGLARRKAEQLGMRVEVIPSRANRPNYPLLTSRLYINSYLTEVHDISNQHVPNTVLLSPRNSTSYVDFLLYILPNKQWMVVPLAEAPKGKTMFRLKPQFGRSGARNWRQYIEAWHLLENPTPKDNNAAKSP